jgi:cyanosortase A-associated protein
MILRAKSQLSQLSNLKTRIKHRNHYPKWGLLLISAMISIAIATSWLAPPQRPITYNFTRQPLDLGQGKFTLISHHNFDTNPQVSHIIATQRYIYKANQEKIIGEIQIDFLYLNRTVDVFRELKALSIRYEPTSLQARNNANTGHYVMFNAANRAYLATCINPRGNATITDQQFIANRNKYDISGDRLVLYLLGISDLRDHRCLLTLLSVPHQSSNQLSHQLLESVWEVWYQYWQYNFPKESSNSK